MDIHGFWRVVLAQDAGAIPAYFTEDAVIRWHCSNEQFTVAEFVRVNCEYPGDWFGEVERVYAVPEGVLTITRVFPRDKSVAFHVTSVFTLRGEQIAALDEYWADHGPAPQWRQDMQIGNKINLSF